MKYSAFRNIALFTRISAGLFAGAALAFFAIITHNVFDVNFPSVESGLTVLPAIALSCSILWNIIAVTTVSRMFKLWYIMGDTLIAITMLVLGTIGFQHDNNSYLSNGLWQQYDDGPWLTQEIIGGCLMIVAFVLQIILVCMGILGPRRAVMHQPMVWRGTDQYQPPVYVEAPMCTRKHVDDGFQSFASSEGYPSVKKPEPVKAGE